MKNVLVERFQQLAGIKPLYEQGDDENSSKGEMQVFDSDGQELIYNYVDEADEIANEIVIKDLEELDNKLQNIDPNKFVTLTDTSAKDLAIGYANLVKLGLALPLYVLKGAAEETNNASRIEWYKRIFTNKFFIGFLVYAGFDREFRFETVERVLRPETPKYEKIQKIVDNIWGWFDKSYDPNAPTIIHEKVYNDDGTGFFIAAGVVLIVRLLLAARLSYIKVVPKKDEPKKGFFNWIKRKVGLQEQESSDLETEESIDVDLPDMDSLPDISKDDAINYAIDIIDSYTKTLKTEIEETLTEPTAQAAE